MGILLTEFVDMQSLSVLTEKAETGKEPVYKIKGIMLQADAKNKNGRTYPKIVLEKEIKRYSDEKIKTRRAMGQLEHCFTDSALILTKDGWKYFKDLSDDEEVLTLNPDTNEIEIKTINKKIINDYDGNAYKIKSRYIDTIVTEFHNLFVVGRYGKKELISVDSIYKNRKKYDHHSMLRTGDWIGEEPDNITIKGLSADVIEKHSYRKDYSSDIQINSNVFMGFMGIWLAEGCLHKGRNEKNAIQIYQKNKDNIILIRELLSKFPKELEWKEYNQLNGMVCFRLNDARLARYLEPLGDCYTKYIPAELKQLSASLLDELLWWFNLGDGRFVKPTKPTYSGVRNVFTVSHKLIMDLSEILIKSGGSGHVIEDSHKNFKRKNEIPGNKTSENIKPIHQLNIYSTSRIYMHPEHLKIEPMHFTGKTYCVNVPNNIIYVMDNGKCFWSGNCNDPQIHLDRVSHIVEDLHMEGNDGYGTAKLIDTPMGRIAMTLVKENILLGMSTRGVGTMDTQGIVNDDYQIAAIDLIADPSAPKAFVEGIIESKEWIIGPNGIFVEAPIGNMMRKVDKKFTNESAALAMKEFIHELNAKINLKNMI